MSTAFVSVPLFRGIDEQGLAGLGEVFDRHAVAAGELLFASGDVARYVYLLIDGSVAIQEDGETEIELDPPSLIGELGAMTQLARRVTAVALEPSVFLRATGDRLSAFFTRNADVATAFYQNLLGMAADKIRRDERRIDDMRGNIIATQKSLKRLRNLVLESPDTAVSQPVHDILEGLITQNRRANYIVEPPMALPAYVRVPSGATFPVSRMSRQFLVVPSEAGAGMREDWRGVLVLPDAEIPVGGALDDSRGALRVSLDILLDEYSDVLESYLTQARLLDIVL